MAQTSTVTNIDKPLLENQIMSLCEVIDHLRQNDGNEKHIDDLEGLEILLSFVALNCE